MDNTLKTLQNKESLLTLIDKYFLECRTTFIFLTIPGHILLPPIFGSSPKSFSLVPLQDNKRGYLPKIWQAEVLGAKRKIMGSHNRCI